MRKQQWQAPKKKAVEKEPAKTAGDGPIAENMRQATKSAGKKAAKARTLDDVIELLRKHGIHFSDEE